LVPQAVMQRLPLKLFAPKLLDEPLQ